MKNTLSKILVTLFLFLASISIGYSSLSCSELCDQCGDPGQCQDIYGGNAEACYNVAPECGGAPINESAYLLVIIGCIFSLLVTTFYFKRKN